MVEDGKYPVYGANGIIGRYNNFNHESSEIAITCRGATCGTINLTKPFSWITGNAMVCKVSDTEKINKKYLFYVLKSSDLNALITGSAQPQITRQNFHNFKIPLPPIETQNQVVKELDDYQKIIDGCRQVIDNYKPSIDIDPSWKNKTLGDYILINNGQTLTEFDKDGDLAAIKVSDMNLEKNEIKIQVSNNKVQSSRFKPTHILKPNSIIFPKRGAAIATNKKRITTIPCVIDNNCMGITVKNENILVPHYLFYFLIGFDLTSISKSAGIALINNPDISSVKIPIPDISIQNRIVEKIKDEFKIIESNKLLFKNFNEKINQTINKIWSI